MRSEKGPSRRRAATDNLRVAPVSSLDGYRDAWDDLVERSRIPSPFMRSWWVENAAAAEPRILLCLDPEGTLMGGIALEADTLALGPLRVPRLSVIGQGPLAPDHIDVVSVRGARTAVLGAVGSWLRSGDRVVDLDGLTATCELPWLLDAPVISREPAPYLRLGSTDPVAELPGRLRSTVKRSAKRLARSGFEVVRVTPGSDGRDESRPFEAALDTLLELHSGRWREESTWGGEAEVLRRTLLAGLVRGEAVIHELTDGTEVIASELELICGNRIAFYQAGRLTDHAYRGSGSVLKAEVVRWAAAGSMSEFDLLRGADSYKDDWSNATAEVHRMRCGFGTLGRPLARALNAWRIAAPAATRIASRLPPLTGPGASRPRR